jgi:hypothetical protein
MNQQDETARSRSIASLMERLSPAMKKQVQIEIMSGVDPRTAIMKAMGQ